MGRQSVEISGRCTGSYSTFEFVKCKTELDQLSRLFTSVWSKPAGILDGIDSAEYLGVMRQGSSYLRLQVGH